MNQACQLFLGAPTGIGKWLETQQYKGFHKWRLKSTVKHTDRWTSLKGFEENCDASLTLCSGLGPSFASPPSCKIDTTPW